MRHRPPSCPADLAVTGTPRSQVGAQGDGDNAQRPAAAVGVETVIGFTEAHLAQGWRCFPPVLTARSRAVYAEVPARFPPGSTTSSTSGGPMSPTRSIPDEIAYGLLVHVRTRGDRERPASASTSTQAHCWAGAIDPVGFMSAFAPDLTSTERTCVKQLNGRNGRSAQTCVGTTPAGMGLRLTGASLTCNGADLPDAQLDRYDGPIRSSGRSGMGPAWSVPRCSCIREERTEDRATDASPSDSAFQPGSPAVEADP